MFLQEGLNLINWFKYGVSYLIAHQHVSSSEMKIDLVINNGMTKNYHGVYRSESKENPIVVLTLD